ncbi:MAG: tetratricopeptide repeat protein, partial [Defluviitaleaceae bacterium]|nr:tetratricopeptide repeat protein [Defluviitaleaceae bacterium]
DYPKALEWYYKALAIAEKVLGLEHPHTAATYNNIAGVYDNQGDYPKALELYLKSYTINLVKLGIIHPNTQITKRNMELTYSETNPNRPFEEWLLEQDCT